MLSSDLLSFIRADVLRDSALPYLYSDALIYRYLTEAQEIHARRVYSIFDDAKTVVTVASTPSYALPTGTLMVSSARVSTRGYDMRPAMRSMLPSQLATNTGEPWAFTLDEATGKIRVYPVPDAVYTINLRVARLPTAAITGTGSPEIPAQYHMDLADYAAWRCLQGNDVDGQSVGAADRHKADWEMRLSDAKRETYRLRMNANPRAIHSWTGKRG